MSTKWPMLTRHSPTSDFRMTSERVYPINSNDRFVEDIISPVNVSPLVLDAFKKVDRKLFVPPNEAGLAYADRVIPYAEGSFLSQPTLVARMIDLLDLNGEEKVLEIGTASGFNAALLSRCADSVATIEYQPEVAQEARDRLNNLGFENIQVITGDGVLGWEEGAPYDAIIVTASAESMPPALIDQLAEGGRIVIPIGHHIFGGKLIVGLKQGGEMKVKDMGEVTFQPLMSSEVGGWTREKLYPDTDFEEAERHKKAIFEMAEEMRRERENVNPSSSSLRDRIRNRNNKKI